MTKNIKSANFWRGGGNKSCIEVFLDGLEAPIDLWEGIIKRNAAQLGEIELTQVISLLLCEKETMEKECNFPPVFEEMLSDLIKVQEERYDIKKAKKVKLGYSVSISKLEEILELYFKTKKVHAYSIDVGSDRANAERIDLESDYRYLVLSFREEAKEDE